MPLVSHEGMGLSRPSLYLRGFPPFACEVTLCSVVGVACVGVPPAPCPLRHMANNVVTVTWSGAMCDSIWEIRLCTANRYRSYDQSSHHPLPESLPMIDTHDFRPGHI
ncbi:hypothetical protein DM860_008393 [Cuscuta australis]|uniref:Uncharacterized protein n=1 Tax=Cuscuta australis TaxID=267555 RepID=A0A328D8F3_9ASTE|nr:hypothetical protein DM860_008393 [Cuscuta australis]